jgi:hypothetical protein
MRVLPPRVIKTFGNIRESNPTSPNNIEGFTAQDGTGATGTMGEGSEGVAASSCDNEENGVGSCEAHDVGVSPKENRGGTAGKVG